MTPAQMYANALRATARAHGNNTQFARNQPPAMPVMAGSDVASQGFAPYPSMPNAPQAPGRMQIPKPSIPMPTGAGGGWVPQQADGVRTLQSGIASVPPSNAVVQKGGMPVPRIPVPTGQGGGFVPPVNDGRRY